MDSQSVYQFGQFTLDPKSQSFYLNSDEIKLEPRIFDVLHLLITKPNEVITKEEFFDFVWEEKVVSDWALSRAIKEVRKKLKDTNNTPWIKTIYGKGYLFTQAVKVLSSEEYKTLNQSAQQLPNNSSSQVQQNNHIEQTSTFQPNNPQAKLSIKPTRKSFLLTKVMLVFVVSVGLFYFGSKKLIEANQNPAIVHSIAVLPINNLDNSSEYDYLVNGLTDVIIGRLAQDTDLRVISRTSAMYYQDKNMSSQQIALELGVGNILEGSFYPDKGDIHLNLRLINAKNDELIWSIHEKQPANAVYSLYQTVANRVAEKLMPDIQLQNNVHQVTDNITDQETFKLYLRASYLFKKRGEANLQEAEKLLLEALGRDNQFAEAYSKLAAVYVQLSSYSINRNLDRFSLAKSALNKALELKPHLSEAWAHLGLIEFGYHYNFKAAEQAYLKAIDLNPGNISAKQWYAELLSITSRDNEALKLIEDTWQNDPFNRLLITVWASTYMIKGDYPKALEKLSLAESIGDKLIWHDRELSYTYQWQKNYDAALKVRLGQMEQSHYTKEQIDNLKHYAQTNGLLGFWQWRLPHLLKKWNEGKLNATRLAETYAALGDYEQMLFWFKKGIEQKSEYWVQLVKRSPEFYPYRNEPEFKALLTSYGLSLEKKHLE